MQDLCAGFCALANVAAPELREQDDGVIAFNVHWQEVSVDVIVKPAADAEHAFVLFDLGAPDLPGVEPARMLLALMHNNFMALRMGQPVFSCHPETDRIVLQWPVALGQMTPAGLHQVIEEGAALARLWRHDGFVSGEDASQAAAAVPPDGRFA